MYCKYCGKEIDDNSKFCKNCGKSLESSVSKVSENRLSDFSVGNLKINALAGFTVVSIVTILLGFANWFSLSLISVIGGGSSYSSSLYGMIDTMNRINNLGNNLGIDSDIFAPIRDTAYIGIGVMGVCAVVLILFFISLYNKSRSAYRRGIVFSTVAILFSIAFMIVISSISSEVAKNSYNMINLSTEFAPIVIILINVVVLLWLIMEKRKLPVEEKSSSSSGFINAVKHFFKNRHNKKNKAIIISVSLLFAVIISLFVAFIVLPYFDPYIYGPKEYTYDIYRCSEYRGRVDIIEVIDKDVTVLEIPEEINGIDKISIMGIIPTINDHGALFGCERLTSIDIPKSVRFLDSDVFYECPELRSINVSDDNEDYYSRDGVLYRRYYDELVFYPPKHGDVFSIPDFTYTIGDSAFYNCTSLKKISIPNSITEIGDHAFSGCTSLKEISIPNSIIKINDFTFSRCTNLEEVNIPNSVTQIGLGAFEGCTGLEAINIPNSVAEIGSQAFNECINLKKITFPDSITKIAINAFMNCTNLKKISIPYSVTEIGDCAFYDCTGLEDIYIPDSVNEIGYNAFSGCSNLTIYGRVGSVAEKYANNNNIPFIAQ